MAKLDRKWSNNGFVNCTVQHENTGDFLIQKHTLHIVASGQGATLAQLPTPEADLNVFIKVMTDDIATDSLTIVRSGIESIDGVASNYQLTSEKETIHLVSDGTDWFII